MCQKLQFGPQNIVWGLNFGAQGGRVLGPPRSATDFKISFIQKVP